MTENHQVRLAARPQGLPTADVWEHTVEPVPEPGDGRFVVRVTHLSLDPAMCGWMNDVRSYVPPVGLGEVMRAMGAGLLIASNACGGLNPQWERGDIMVIEDHINLMNGNPLVGVNVVAQLTERWAVRAEADIGGFGVGSDLTWNAQAIVTYRWTVGGYDVLAGAGYRALYWDYQDGDFAWDVTMSGPMLGAAVRF